MSDQLDGWFPIHDAVGLAFENTPVGVLKKEVWEAPEAEVDRVLADYGIPSPPELGDRDSYIQNTVRQQLEANRRQNDLVFIPIGSCENHGPHTVSAFDTLLVTCLLEGVRRHDLKRGRPTNIIAAAPELRLTPPPSRGHAGHGHHPAPGVQGSAEGRDVRPLERRLPQADPGEQPRPLLAHPGDGAGVLHGEPAPRHLPGAGLALRRARVLPHPRARRPLRDRFRPRRRGGDLPRPAPLPPARGHGPRPGHRREAASCRPTTWTRRWPAWAAPATGPTVRATWRWSCTLLRKASWGRPPSRTLARGSGRWPPSCATSPSPGRDPGALPGGPAPARGQDHPAHRRGAGALHQGARQPRLALRLRHSQGGLLRGGRRTRCCASAETNWRRDL